MFFNILYYRYVIVFFKIVSKILKVLKFINFLIVLFLKILLISFKMQNIKAVVNFTSGGQLNFSDLL
jgi:hypothetical protein